MIKLFIIIIILCGVSISQALEKWKVTTLEWPPFTCEKCPEQGAGAKVLRDAMRAVGIEVEFVFLPWTRAINEGADAKKYIGYYPSWPEDVQKGFVPSLAMYKSPLGFIEPKGKPLVWDKLSDLKGKKIGSVQDYGNTKEFNQLVKDGVILNEVVVSDDVNVKKVAGSRLDGAIIDINNAKWFLANSMKSEAKTTQVNPKVLEDKNLHVAFNEASKAKAALVTEAFKKIDAQKIVDDYIKTHVK